MRMYARRSLSTVFLLQCPNLIVLLVDQGINLVQYWEYGSHGGSVSDGVMIRGMSLGKGP